MLIGAAPKWTLTGDVRGSCMHSIAGPVLGGKRSEAIRRQPHGNPPARQAAGRMFDVAGGADRHGKNRNTLPDACPFATATQTGRNRHSRRKSHFFEAGSAFRPAS